jgi:hypothetical protein
MEWYSEVQEFHYCLVVGIFFFPTVVLSRTDLSSVVIA